MNDSMIRLLFLAHCAVTLYMTGVIWFVQVVSLPLCLASVGAAEFSTYEQRHTNPDHLGSRCPPMLVELATALLLVWFRPQGVY